MATPLTSLSGIFTGITNSNVSNGAITIPSGTITSYVPTSVTAPSPAEFVFGMCETMNAAVSIAGQTNCTSTASQSLNAAGDTLTKVYTFTVNLDFTGNQVANLNVKAESQSRYFWNTKETIMRLPHEVL